MRPHSLRRHARAVAAITLALLLPVGWFLIRPAGAESVPPSPGRGRAAPHILPFAGQVPGRANPPADAAGPARVKLAEGYDGCDDRYGARHQCVPWRFPKGPKQRCAWLREHGFGPLAVHGRDRHRLDTNGDGIACGPGDARS